MSNSVANRSPEIEAMLQMSAPCRDLMKGGQHMREQGETYLPKFPQETEEDYEARLASTWLFDGVGKTIDDLSGKVFETPVILAETDTDLDIWAFNVDLQGRDIAQFSRDVFDKLNLNKDLKDELVLAIAEAAQNIVKHAYKGVEDTKDHMQIKISMKDNQLEIGFYDKGKPVVSENIQHRKLDDIKPGGLGTYFIKQIMDDAVFKKDQQQWVNHLVLTKRL